jgi:hypothetical protein
MADDDDDVFAMLGGAADQAARRSTAAGNSARPPPHRSPPSPPLAAQWGQHPDAAALGGTSDGEGREEAAVTHATYYQGDRSTRLRLVQVHALVAATVLDASRSPVLDDGAEVVDRAETAPWQDSLAALRQRLALAQHRAPAPPRATLRAAALLSPLLRSAAERGLRGLAAAEDDGTTAAGWLSHSAVEAMQSVGAQIRADLCFRRQFLPPSLGRGGLSSSTMDIVEAVAGSSADCVAGAQLILAGLYPEESRAPPAGASSRFTPVEVDLDACLVLGAPAEGDAEEVDGATATTQLRQEVGAVLLDGACYPGVLNVEGE